MKSLLIDSQNTLRSFRAALAEHILRRISATEMRTLACIYPRVKRGELLTGVAEHSVFQAYWERARAKSFALLKLHGGLDTCGADLGRFQPNWKRLLFVNWIDKRRRDVRS